MQNPFSVFSPEGLQASEVVELFVENSPGVDSMQAAGHSMLVGPRGAGKSMLLRFMEPDCQRLAQAKLSQSQDKVTHLRYYTAYVTIRETELSLPSITLSENSHANVPLNEHLLVLTISLSMLARGLKNDHFSAVTTVSQDTLTKAKALVEAFSSGGAIEQLADSSEHALIASVIRWLAGEHEYAMDYFGQLVMSSNRVSFDRKLFRFAGFLAPLVSLLKSMPSLQSIPAFYLAIDDADRLSEIQTKIINSWLARRNNEFSIKVSYEMFGYKTFSTTSDTRIEAPHDYQEVRITDIYTSNHKTNYRDRMRLMIGRRLARAGLTRTANNIPDVDAFFPEDHNQALQLERLRKARAEELQRSGSRSLRHRDDLYRYVLPDFITSLGGDRKKRSTYRYSGFDQLVDISSGVPRYFLEAAQKMYDRQVVKSGTKVTIKSISSEVQDSVVRDLAAELYVDELEKLRLDPRSSATPDVAIRLNNLVGSLGGLFEKILNDPKASERRVFSFALSEYPDDQIESVLRLGLKLAFFSRSSIGRKEGFGRTEKYVLSRRFAPHWNLDPSGFSAYKFLTNNELRSMMENPNSYRLRLRREAGFGDDVQLEMPLDGGEGG